MLFGSSRNTRIRIYLNISIDSQNFVKKQEFKILKLVFDLIIIFPQVRSKYIYENLDYISNILFFNLFPCYKNSFFCYS